jgi:hypothetical protein
MTTRFFGRKFAERAANLSESLCVSPVVSPGGVKMGRLVPVKSRIYFSGGGGGHEKTRQKQNGVVLCL